MLIAGWVKVVPPIQGSISKVKTSFSGAFLSWLPSTNLIFTGLYVVTVSGSSWLEKRAASRTLLQQNSMEGYIQTLESTLAAPTCLHMND